MWQEAHQDRSGRPRFSDLGPVAAISGGERTEIVLGWRGAYWCRELLSGGSLITVASRELDRLRRWEGAGGGWQVLTRGPDWVEVALLSCTLGEEMDRLRSSDPDVLEYVHAAGTGADSTPTA